MSRPKQISGGYPSSGSVSLAHKIAYKQWINQHRRDALSDDGLGRNYRPSGAERPKQIPAMRWKIK